MSVYQIVFSPTGGTQKVSSIFTKSFSPDNKIIDLCSYEIDFSSCSFEEQDICIVSVPSYGGRVPEIAVSRLHQIKGNKARAILLVVYGNRAYEDTFTELQDVLEESGFSCIAAVAAVAEHSIMRQFAAGRPDDRDKQELAAFAAEIRSKIESETLRASLKLPGNRPYREYGGVPMIPLDNPSKTDAKKCISCMRCIAVCPQKARSVSKTLLAAGSLKMKKVCSVRKGNELFV